MSQHSSTGIKKPLDMERVRRVMSNALLDGTRQNRLRASVNPDISVDPETNALLGKTLGELLDNRDLAHDEFLNTEKRARNVVTEKQSIRNEISDLKAKIELKKHRLDNLVSENKGIDRMYSLKSDIDKDTTTRSKVTSKVLLDEAKSQLNEAYSLRDKLLSAGAGSKTVAIPPQVKANIENRMADLESRIDRDIQDSHRKAASLEENLDHAQKAVIEYNQRVDDTKHTMKEIIKDSDQLNKDIEREIDSRDQEITDNSNQLRNVLREKQDLKWKIGFLESEVNNLEFTKSKLDLELEVKNLKDNKEDIIIKLNQRIDDAKYNEKHIRDLIQHADDIDIDVGFLERIDAKGEREVRLRDLKDSLELKRRAEENQKEEIRQLNDRLRALGEVNVDSSTFILEENYSAQLKDLQIGYSDIILSMKDHLAANAAILRKEKEIKEMEARIALIDLEALDEEYSRLRIQYDRDAEILRDLEDRYSLIHDRLIRLKARLREISDNIRSLEDRLETARFEVQDAERKYALIKIPKKVEYIVNERVEDVLVSQKYLVPQRTKISTQKLKEEERRRSTTKAVGADRYRPTLEEMYQIIPQGSKVTIRAEGNDGWYRYGTKRFFFIKGEDGEYYVNYEGTRMHIDDFVSLYEAEERDKSQVHTSKFAQIHDIADEEANADVGDEMEGHSHIPPQLRSDGLVKGGSRVKKPKSRR